MNDAYQQPQAFEWYFTYSRFDKDKLIKSQDNLLPNNLLYEAVFSQLCGALVAL